MGKKPLLFYGWIVLAVSFTAMVLANLSRSSFSVFYVAILKEFGWSRASTAAIFSVSVITFGIAAPLVGGLVDRFGPRKIILPGVVLLSLAIAFCSTANTIYHFYLLFGIAVAVGSSLIGYPANAAVLPHWFIRRRGMAFGIFNSGLGISFLLVPLVQSLIIRFGWRNSFLLMGVMVGAILLPLVAIFSRHKPQDIGLAPDGIDPSKLEREKSTSHQETKSKKVNKKWANVNWDIRKAMRTYQFWLMFLINFCVFGFVQNLVAVHQIALMIDVGFSSSFAASIVALLGVMMAGGSLSSFISDTIGREKAFTLACFACTIGLFILLLLQENARWWMPYLYAIFLGLGLGMFGPVLGATVADIFIGRNFGSINGFMPLGFGMGGILGPWFGGMVFDATKSYSIALIIAILATWLACAFMWLAAPRKIREPG